MTIIQADALSHYSKESVIILNQPNYFCMESYKE